MNNYQEKQLAFETCKIDRNTLIEHTNIEHKHSGFIIQFAVEKRKFSSALPISCKLITIKIVIFFSRLIK